MNTHVGINDINKPYKHIIVAGDQLRDVLLPEEGKRRLSLARESDADEPLSKMEAIKIDGGLACLKWMLNAKTFDNVMLHFPAVLTPENMEEVHWGVRLLPRDLYLTGRNDAKVYRVTDRHFHRPRFVESDVFSTDCKKDRGLFESALTIIADYGYNLTKQTDWNYYKEQLRYSKIKSPLVRRIILLARRLPYPVMKGRSAMADEVLWNHIYENGKLDPSQRDTLIITSLDRLRQDGAKISKRISWDKTFEDFASEMGSFPLLKRLGMFGHLVVRIGVCGAFYCRTVLKEDGTPSHRTISLIYDPEARAGIFRDLLSQGNAFGTRSAFAACIAKSLIDGVPQDETERIASHFPDQYDKDQTGAITRGIINAIHTNQFLYREGFGDTITAVRNYPRSLGGRVEKHLAQDKLKEKFIHVITHHKMVTQTDWGIVYTNLLCEKPEIPAIDETAIRNSNIDLSEQLIQDAIDKAGILNREHVRLLLEFRRLRCATQIVLSGIDAIVNQYLHQPRMNKPIEAQLALERTLLELTWTERVDVETEVCRYFRDTLLSWKSVKKYILDNTIFNLKDKDRFEEVIFRVNRAIIHGRQLLSLLGQETIDLTNLTSAILQIIDQVNGSISASDLRKCLENLTDHQRDAHGLFTSLCSPDEERRPKSAALIEGPLEEIGKELNTLSLRLQRLSVPFNFPVADFGSLRVIGKRDVEAFNDIRNRISFHIQSEVQMPLSIAVFGPPGSGKSYGVTEIAREHGVDVFEEILCNLSQCSDITFLHKTFVRIGDAVASRKIPLVFFDEFDSSLTDKPFSWLKYFLQPMQDGYYQHPDGRISVGNSIFIFAGGTHASYWDFQRKAADDGNNDVKQAKLPDFVSRLKGFVNIPYISPEPRPTKVDAPDSVVVVGQDRHEIPMLRRAMLVRSILIRKQMVRPFNDIRSGCRDCGFGLIDVDLLRALLLVKTYRHGARSISALLDVASPFYNVIAKASLPNNEQLGMHTKQDDFNSLLKSPFENGNISSLIRNRLLFGTGDVVDDLGEKSVNYGGSKLEQPVE